MFDYWMDDIENNGIFPTELGSHLSPIVGDLYCILFKQAKDLHAKDRPVSTQENKHRIRLDFFPSCIIHTARPVVDHRFKLEQKIGTESPWAGSILLRSGPIPKLLSRAEIAFTMNKNQGVGCIKGV